VSDSADTGAAWTKTGVQDLCGGDAAGKQGQTNTLAVQRTKCGWTWKWRIKFWLSRIKYHVLMHTKSDSPTPSDEAPAATPSKSEHDQVSQNIEAVVDFYAREAKKISRSQRALERVSDFITRPAFLGLILLFVALWIIIATLVRRFGVAAFDPPPFFWLQGIVSLGAFLVATAVLIKQDRLAKLAEQREHLDLKVTLLTEQKVAKLIDLMEELRLDLPNVKDRPDPKAAALKQSMSPDQVLAALDEGGEPQTRLKASSKPGKGLR
jgi:uncharacterized membrane protein